MDGTRQTRPGRTGARLTRIAVAISTVLAGMGVAITTATPAHASVNEIEVDGTGLDFQSANASCGPGEFLSGGAGGIKHGGRDVTLSAIIPHLATESVTVWAHKNPNAGPTTAYHVVAQAICVPALPGDRYLKETTTGVNAAPNKQAVATCDLPDQRVLGTGAALKDASGQPIGELFLRHSFPDVSLTNNTVRADAAFGYAGNWELVSYAICGTPPGAPPHRPAHSSGEASDANSKTASTGGTDLCQAGELTTGVGGAAAPGTVPVGGFVFINRMSTDRALQDNATARAVEGQNLRAGTWYLAVYGICWPR